MFEAEPGDQWYLQYVDLCGGAREDKTDKEAEGDQSSATCAGVQARAKKSASELRRT